MNQDLYLIIASFLSFILGCLVVVMVIGIHNFYFKKKFKLDNLKDIILTSRSNLQIMNKSNELLNKEINKLENILNVLENSKQ